ncbi:hypothetical protein [Mesobacillus boroniphilus]|uniref:hypothetical protein n=1 Tax=Mesobacillus boroniphilus TaxID=308892 RepID=UPI000AE8D3C8|nr:hypothetical protein [Mesobacillus boroniphilus]
MKSLFDFIGRTEATRWAMRWSWTILEVEIYTFVSYKKTAHTHYKFRIPIRHLT